MVAEPKLEGLERAPQALRDPHPIDLIGVGHHHKVAIFAGETEMVSASGLVQDEPGDPLANQIPQPPTVQVHQRLQPIHLNQHAHHRKPVAASPRELRLHQVENLRLRER